MASQVSGVSHALIYVLFLQEKMPYAATENKFPATTSWLLGPLRDTGEMVFRMNFRW
jgi:hypothetical protein